MHSQKLIDVKRCMESDPYSTVAEASETLEYFMDEHGGTTFVSGSVNFPAGMHSQNRDLYTTITLVFVNLVRLNHKILE